MRMRKFISIAAALATAAALAATCFAEVDYTSVAFDAKMLEFKGMAGYAGGQWLVGSDNTPMDNALTIADLEAADHIEISYTTRTEVPPTLTEGDVAKLTFCYKFVTAEDDDGKPSMWEAYLPASWMEYGPNEAAGSGHTYASMDYFSFDVDPVGGTLIIPTADIIASLQVDPSTILYLSQFGIGCNMYDFDSDWTDENEFAADYFIDITSIILSDEPAPVTTVAETEPETEATTEAAPETEAATETTTAATTAAPAAQSSSFPVWLIIVIAAAVVIVVVVVIVIVAKKKK